LLIDEKEIAISPNISTIIGNEDGGIADDQNTVMIGVCFQRLPLAKEEKLKIPMVVNRCGQFLAGEFEGGRSAITEIRSPVVPASPTLRLFDRHKHGIVGEPFAVIFAELIVIFLETRIAPALKPFKAAPEESVFRRNKSAVVNVIGGKVAKCRPRFLNGEQALFNNIVDADQ
jgi:hypothetical protein